MAVRFPTPVVIQGRHIRLVPLQPGQVPDLYKAGEDDEVWRWLPTVAPRSEAELGRIVEQRLAQQAAGEAVMFAVEPLSTRRPAGWAAYLDISADDGRVDIGWQWIERSLWGGPEHMETHFALTYHAFEYLGFERVQWQVDHLDLVTKDVVTRIGGLNEGLLRHHIKRSDGSWRDTVLYSLLADEWPAVRDRWFTGWILG
jgi:RimJ/RimL family protein N-acetyltransferase